ncbi:MAG: acyltransferase [Bacteroidota bacterium]
MKALYFKKLDALRFIAFFLVFWHHGFSNSFSSVTWLDKSYIESITLTGGIGVHIFFVISGFLITFLLLKEFEKVGKISIKNFYIRRILRIWPLYYIVLLGGMFFLPQMTHTFQFCGSVWKNLLFLNNYDMVTSCHAPNVGIAWSVAIEEQFYLFWPIVFALLIRNQKLLFTVCLLIFIASSTFILVNPTESYYHTLGNLNYLMTGCMGAIVFNRFKKEISESILMKNYTLSVAVFLMLVLVLYKPWGDDVLLLPFLYLYLVLFLVSKSGETEKKSVLSWLGKYTYGMYMYHPIFIILVKIVFDKFALDYLASGAINAVVAIIALASTIGFSILSYELMEKKFLKLKGNLSQIKTRI